MKVAQFMQSPRVPALVRKYQARWEVCLGNKTCSYHWLEKSSLGNF
jgi:hypothetical protein